MQMNEIVGLVEIGARRPKSKPTPEAPRTTRESRPVRQVADAPSRREAVAETPRSPREYGAGF